MLFEENDLLDVNVLLELVQHLFMYFLVYMKNCIFYDVIMKKL